MGRATFIVLLLSACATEEAIDSVEPDLAVRDLGHDLNDATPDESVPDARSLDAELVIPDVALSPDVELLVSDEGIPDVGPDMATPDVALIPDMATPDAGPAPQFVSMLPNPGLQNPRMRFHTGGVANNGPEIFPNAPEMPDYPVSDWFIAQWAKTFPGEPDGTGLMRPDVMFENAPTTEDSVYGPSRWAFPGGMDNRSHVWIYLQDGQPIYELYSEHGWLSPGCP